MFMKTKVLGVAEVKRWAAPSTLCLDSKQENKASELRPLDLAPRIAFGKCVCLRGTGQSVVAQGFNPATAALRGGATVNEFSEHNARLSVSILRLEGTSGVRPLQGRYVEYLNF
jgi:hypothetical protein